MPTEDKDNTLPDPDAVIDDSANDLAPPDAEPETADAKKSLKPTVALLSEKLPEPLSAELPQPSNTPAQRQQPPRIVTPQRGSAVPSGSPAPRRTIEAFVAAQTILMRVSLGLQSEEEFEALEAFGYETPEQIKALLDFGWIKIENGHIVEIDHAEIGARAPGSFRKFKHLRKLTFQPPNNIVPRIRNIDFVSEMPELEELDISMTYVDDLSPLTSLKKLRVFRASRTDVENLEPLRECKTLEVLDLGNTRITDITPLAALTNLEILDISWCQKAEKKKTPTEKRS